MNDMFPETFIARAFFRKQSGPSSEMYGFNSIDPSKASVALNLCQSIGLLNNRNRSSKCLVAFPKNINIAKTFHVTKRESLVTLNFFP